MPGCPKSWSQPRRRCDDHSWSAGPVLLAGFALPAVCCCTRRAARCPSRIRCCSSLLVLASKPCESSSQTVGRPSPSASELCAAAAAAAARQCCVAWCTSSSRLGRPVKPESSTWNITASGLAKKKRQPFGVSCGPPRCCRLFCLPFHREGPRRFCR